MTAIALQYRDPVTPTSVSLRQEGLSAYITWDATADPDDVVEVWWSATNNRATASLIATTVDEYYIDSEYSTIGTFYYWLRRKSEFNYSDWSTGNTSGHSITLGGYTSSSLNPSTVSSASVSISGSTTSATVSSYGVWYEVASGTFTAGANTFSLINAYITHNLTSPSVSLGQILAVKVRARLYDNTAGADVPGGTDTRVVYLNNAIAAYGANPGITSFSAQFLSGFRGLLTSGRSYTLYIEGGKFQDAGSPTGSLSIGGGVTTSSSATLS